jgi:hypothetical protein
MNVDGISDGEWHQSLIQRLKGTWKIEISKMRSEKKRVTRIKFSELPAFSRLVP